MPLSYTDKNGNLISIPVRGLSAQEVQAVAERIQSKHLLHNPDAAPFEFEYVSEDDAPAPQRKAVVTQVKGL